MKKNLNEEIGRIKQVMGLNEKEIDMTNYKFVEEDDPIKDMSIVDIEGEASGKVATVLIKMRVFVPNEEDKGVSYKGLFGGSKGRQMVFDFYVMFDRGDHVVKVVKSEVEDAMGMNKNYLDYWKTVAGNMTFKEGVKIENVMFRIYDGYLKMLDDEEINVKMGALNRMKRNTRKLEAMLGDAFMEHDNVNPSHPQRVKEPEVKKEPEIDNTPKNNDMWTSTNSWASE